MGRGRREEPSCSTNLTGKAVEHVVHETHLCLAYDDCSEMLYCKLYSQATNRLVKSKQV